MHDWATLLERKYLLETFIGVLIFESSNILFTINNLAWFYLLIRHCTLSRILDIKSFTLIIIIITYGSNRNIKGLDWLLLGVKWLIKWKDHAKNLRKFRLRHFRCVLDATLRMTNGQTDQSLQPPPLACLRVDDPESLDNFGASPMLRSFSPV